MADEAETVVSEPVVAEAPLDKALREWAQQIIAGSVISQHTDAWNHLVSVALPDLKERLQPLLKE